MLVGENLVSNHFKKYKYVYIFLEITVYWYGQIGLIVFDQIVLTM